MTDSNPWRKALIVGWLSATLVGLLGCPAQLGEPCKGDGCAPGLACEISEECDSNPTCKGVCRQCCGARTGCVTSCPAATTCSQNRSPMFGEICAPADGGI